jgi:hypothetical protein
MITSLKASEETEKHVVVVISEILKAIQYDTWYKINSKSMINTRKLETNDAIVFYRCYAS